MIFIIQKRVAPDSDYCLAWAFSSREELFSFFHEDCHDQIEEGLSRQGMFSVHSGPEEYRVSVAVKPFYMEMEQTNGQC